MGHQARHGDDPASESPWALQLVARIEKSDPPSTVAVCQAAAAATIALLADPRSEPGGEWHEPVSTWNGARIRKLVRRARGAAWDRVQALPGVTASRDQAQVRAFVPSPMADAHPDLARLQIRSTPLDDPPRVGSFPASDPGAMAVAITPEVEMSWGKQAAQCAHAAQRLWLAAAESDRAAWRVGGDEIVVALLDAGEWARRKAHAVDHGVAIHDGGFTEIPAGTNTTIAWWT